ncbi:MAG: peptidoglycan DD-metalloendopeptidase family protein [Acidobacteria bacterium]|nr:peptidoglycan DD-metalloendopeptidase family protein [Acidobacteriota bacterium]
MVRGAVLGAGFAVLGAGFAVIGAWCEASPAEAGAAREGWVLGADGIEITARSRAMQPGELVVLNITLPQHADRVTVRAFDRDAVTFADNDRQWRALVGIDLDVKAGTYPITVDAGGLHASYDLAVAPHRFPTRRLTVDQVFVTPPASEEARIARDAKLLADTWTSPSPRRLWTDHFVRPVPGAANSAFGSRSIFNGKARTPHGGADFMSPSGTPIHAPNAGRVVLARNLYYSGNTVVIDHGLGLFSMLAHLSAIDVHEGDRVDADQIVGKVGATGRVTGAHLHWAIRAGGARVDPLAVLALLGD